MLSSVKFLDRQTINIGCCCRWLVFDNFMVHKIRFSSYFNIQNQHKQYLGKNFKLQKQFAQNVYFTYGKRYTSQQAHKVTRNSRRTFYDILEVEPSATQPEIKSAYYELSLKYHPDVSSNPEARDNFTEITKAYSILGKIESRREYDKEIGTYYMMRNYSKKSSEKILRLMDNVVEIDIKDVKHPSTFLHTAAALSTISRTPIRINNIKHKTGVQSHDIRMLQLLRKVSNGTLVAAKGSSTITFLPSEVDSGTFTMEAGRFGSISILIESALPCLMFGPIPNYSKTNILSLKGTTHSNYGLNMDFIEKVYGPLVNKFGLEFTMEMRKRSYLPYWEGKVFIRSLPTTHVKPATLTDLGNLTKITCLCSVAGSKPIRVAQIMAKTVFQQLKKKFPKIPIIIESTRDRDSRCEGNGQTIVIVGKTSTGHTIGGTALWQKGMSNDEVVNKAFEMFVRNIESGNCIDEVLQDKIFSTG